MNRPPLNSRVLPWLVFGAVAGAVVWMAWWFVSPLLWATFIALGVWPIYSEVYKRLEPTAPTCARHLPLLVGAGLLVAVALVFGLAIQAAVEESRNWSSGSALATLKSKFETSGLKAVVKSIPGIGPSLAQRVTAFDPAGLADQPSVSGWILEGGGHWGRELFSWIGASLCCALTLAALLRRGTLFAASVLDGARHALGPSFSNHLTHQASLTRSIFNSIVLLGLAEALLFWTGYSLAGLPQPALLALFTGAAAMIPLAATLFAAFACLYLALSGSLGAALTLGVFSAVILMVVDPIVRPLLAGKNTEMPYWMSMLAMLAGVQSIGLIGLFLGPQLFLLFMFSAQMAWRELAEK